MEEGSGSVQRDLVRTMRGSDSDFRVCVWVVLLFGSHLTLHVRPIDARSGCFAKWAADSLLVTAVSDSDFECVCAVGVQLRLLRTVGGFLRCARQSGAAQRSDYFNEKSHHERLADTESIR